MLLSPEKTKSIYFNIRNNHSFHDRIIYKCLHCLCSCRLCNDVCAVVSETKSVKYLGLLLDSNLYWKSHISKLKSKLCSVVRMIYILRRNCSVHTLCMIYFALIQSRIEYRLTCWRGIYIPNIKPLFTLQKHVVRVIMKKSMLESSRPLFQNLKILSLRYLFIYKTLKLFYLR